MERYVKSFLNDDYGEIWLVEVAWLFLSPMFRCPFILHSHTMFADDLELTKFAWNILVSASEGTYACGSMTCPNKLRWRYNAVNFIQIQHIRHSKARLLGWDMRCLLWVQDLIYILPQSLHWCVQYAISCYIGPGYNGTLLYAFMAKCCEFFLTHSYAYMYKFIRVKSVNIVNTGSGNGLVLPGFRLLLEPNSEKIHDTIWCQHVTIKPYGI